MCVEKTKKKKTPWRPAIRASPRTIRTVRVLGGGGKNIKGDTGKKRRHGEGCH